MSTSNPARRIFLASLLIIAVGIAGIQTIKLFLNRDARAPGRAQSLVQVNPDVRAQSPDESGNAAASTRAADDGGDDAPPPRYRRTRAADQPIERCWALLIGVNGYEDAPNLRYCGRDMESLRSCLEEAGFQSEHSTALHDQAEPDLRPSTANINAQLDRLLGPFDREKRSPTQPGLVSEGDLIVIGFSGHGVHLNGQSYFCPSDARLDDSNTLIPLDDIYARLSASPATQKLLIVDACRNDPTQPRAARAGRARGTRELSQTLEQPPSGILVLNSCTTGEYSYEDDDFQQGVFTHYLVEGLKGSADSDGDGSVTLLDLYMYAHRETRSRVAEVHGDRQVPMLKGELSGDFEIGSRHRRFQEYLSDGMKALSAGDFGKARELFDKSLELAPRSVEARLARGAVALEECDLNQAFQDCAEALRIRPSSEEAHTLRAQAYMLESKSDLALAECEEAIRVNPKYAPAYETRGRIRWLVNNGDEQAVADAIKALELDPRLTRAYDLKASAQRDMGDAISAKATAKTALALMGEPAGPTDYLHRAWLRSFSPDTKDQSLADLNASLKLNPKSGLGHLELAYSHYNEGRLDEAMESITQAKTLLPRFAPILIARGDFLRAKSDMEGAEAEYKAALDLLPSATGALLGRAVIASRRGEHERALADLTRVIDSEPQSIAAIIERARVYRGSGRYAKALEDCQRVLELDDENADAYLVRAEVYYQQDKYKEAIQDCTEALRIRPDDIEGLRIRGHCSYSADDYDQCIADYEHILKIEPKNVPAINGLGNVYYSKSNYDVALEKYTEALSIDPEDPVVHQNKGDALYRLARLEDAKQCYDDAIKRAETYAEAYRSRGLCLYRLNKVDDAIKDFESAAEHDPRGTPFPAALQSKCVVKISNRTKSSSDFFLRWKLWDDEWTEWEKFTLEADYFWTISRRGTSESQIQFDHAMGDGKFDATTENLKVLKTTAQVDNGETSPPIHYFYTEGDLQNLGLTDAVKEAAADNVKGVLTLYNYAPHSNLDLNYEFRWQDSDQTWTDWEASKIENGHWFWHSYIGAIACEIRFDDDLTDGDHRTTYNLQFERVQKDKKLEHTDGRAYYFGADGNTLKLYNGVPPS